MTGKNQKSHGFSACLLSPKQGRMRTPGWRRCWWKKVPRRVKVQPFQIYFSARVVRWVQHPTLLVLVSS